MDKEKEKGSDFLLGLTGLQWWTAEDDIKVSATKHAPGLLKSISTAFNPRNGKSLGRVLVRFQGLDEEQTEKVPERILKDLAIEEAKTEVFNGNEATAKKFLTGEPPEQKNMPRSDDSNGNSRGIPPGFSGGVGHPHAHRMPPPGYPPQIPGLPPLPPGFGLPPPPFMHMMWGQPRPGGVGNVAAGTKQAAVAPPAAFPGGVGNEGKPSEAAERGKVNGDNDIANSHTNKNKPGDHVQTHSRPKEGYRNSRRRTSRSRSRSRSPMDTRRTSRRSRSPDYYSRRRETRRSRSRSRTRSRSPKRRRGDDDYDYDYDRNYRRSRRSRRSRSRSRSPRRTRDRGVVARLGDDKSAFKADGEQYRERERGDDNDIGPPNNDDPAEKGGGYSGRSSRRRRGGRKSKRNHSGATSNGNSGAGNTAEEFSKKRSKSGRR